MTRPELVNRLEAVIDEMARTRTWGTVQVDFQAGEATVLRKTSTEKLTTEKNNNRVHNQSNY